MWYSAVGSLVTLTLGLLTAPLATEAQRRKVGHEIGGEQLEDVLGVGQVFELIPAQVAQR